VLHGGLPPGEALAATNVLDVDDGQPQQFGGAAGEVAAPQHEISYPDWAGVAVRLYRVPAIIIRVLVISSGLVAAGRSSGHSRDRPDSVRCSGYAQRKSHQRIRYHVMVIYISTFLAEGSGIAFIGYWIYGTNSLIIERTDAFS
jgi:hypothetical protein